MRAWFSVKATRLHRKARISAIALASCTFSAPLCGFAQTEVPQARMVPAARVSDLLPEAPIPMPAKVFPAAFAEATDPQPADEQVSIKGFPKRILFDELAAFRSPAHLRTRDLVWLLPLAGASAASFATDTHAMRDVVSRDTSFHQSNVTASDAMRDVFIGVPVGLFTLGEAVHDDKARETGLLGGEAMIDAYLLGEVVKLVTFRERPNVDKARGAFYQSSAGVDSSFPSGHAIVAWSSAAVLASAYHAPWQQAGAYTLATGVSLTRVLGEQHFPSDVLIGSAAGWLIGHYVYRAHHRTPRGQREGQCDGARGFVRDTGVSEAGGPDAGAGGGRRSPACRKHCGGLA